MRCRIINASASASGDMLATLRAAKAWLNKNQSLTTLMSGAAGFFIPTV
jgi:hypothetical protein